MKVTNNAVVTSNKRKQNYRKKSTTLTKNAKVKTQSQKKSKEPKKKAPKKSSPTKTPSLTFLKSPGMIQCYGVIIMLFAVLLLVSIVSFYFHANNNISHVQSGIASENIARSVGAYLAYGFIHYIFGVFSIGFPLLFFLYGLRITSGKEMLPLGRTTFNVFMTMAWLSLFFGLFFCNGDNDFVSGFFGNSIANFLLVHTGKLVTGIIVLALFIAILILCYSLPLRNWSEKAITAYNDHMSNQENKQNIEKNEKKRGGKRNLFHHEKNTESNEKVSEHEDLDDLYISDHGCLSEEYHGRRTFEFESEHPDGVKEKSFERPKVEEPVEEIEDEVPFELTNHEVAPSSDPVVETTEEVEEANESEAESQEPTIEDVKDLEPYDPRKELSTYEFPPIDLLNDYPAKTATEELMKQELLANKKRIESTLKSFGIPIKKITATVGPTVTLYEIIPDEGVRISKIKNLEDDIALSLAALGIRIIAPIPGRGTIGIEVPNKNANIVSMREIIDSEKFKNNNYALPIGLGRTINNEAFVVDLAKMPHLLVAGATGQGKSVGLNAIITSLLYTKHPCEMKFVLVDPKKVEFTLYSAIENYYLAKLPDEADAIITDTKKVVRTLNALCKEMDDRYDLLKLAKMRNIKEYNAKFCARNLSPAMGHRYLPYIVVIVDEFGDLIMTAGREVETPLARLAQLARAIGIHLVIATQRPSVNIITGSIKANFPARIAFRVQSGVDSKTILDATGANQLIGKGDMLISTGSDLVRLQCAFVDTPEVEKIAEFIQEKAEISPLANPYELPDVPEPGTEPSETNYDDEPSSGEIDPLFIDAASLIVQTQQGSTSFIQRRMKLGYNRAGRIMDQMEEFGIVGQSNGSKPREVLIKTTAQLKEMLESKGML